jgi:UDP:flavonoid glycosyltransferase YjiC (YdhE family)
MEYDSYGSSPITHIVQIDILITNGGYGTIQQALRAGVPMIVSGVGQDKSHTGGIINYIGNGIYNAVHQTDAYTISVAFEEIQKNSSYRYSSPPFN